VSEAVTDRVTVIRRTRGLSLRLGELWEKRELLYFLVWRDVKVRYKQAALGVAWAVVQPLAAMLVFTLIFGRLADLPSEGVPYALFAYVGLLGWTYFSSAVTQSSASLVANPALVTKVYAPRVLLPLAGISVPLVDLAISFVLVVPLMAFYDVVPGWQLAALPAFLALAVLTAAAVGLTLSAVNVRYRDVPYAMPFLMQLWLYASPIVYPATLIPERWQWLYSLNPVVGVVEGLRWSLLGTHGPGRLSLAVSACVAVVGAALAFVYFRRVERHFADRI